MVSKKDNDPASNDDHKLCEHKRIELIGGNGDENGLYDTFRCPFCGWEFDLCVDGLDEN